MFGGFLLNFFRHLHSAECLMINPITVYVLQAVAVLVIAPATHQTLV